MNSVTEPATSQRGEEIFSQVPTAVADENFCATWLAIQCEIISGVKTGLVLLAQNDGSSYEPVANWPGEPGSGGQLVGLAERALRDGTPLIWQRAIAGDGDGDAPGYQVAYPIKHAGQWAGAVALAITARPKEQLEIVVQQLSWGSAWIEVWLQRRRAAQKADEDTRLKSTLEPLATAVSQESFCATAQALVSDLAARLGCQRVSLGWVENFRIKLAALSHSASFAKQTNLSRALEDAMAEAYDQASAIAFPPAADARAQIAHYHQELARQQNSAAIYSLPLGNAEEIYAVLTFERASDRPFDAHTVELCESIASLVGPVLELKRRNEQPATQRLVALARARCAQLTGPEHFAPKVISAAAVVALLFFALAKTEYRVSAKTVIEAHSQRAAVAPFNGYIAESHVRAGDVVRPGQLLFTLDDRDIKLEADKWRSQKEQYVKQYHLALADHNAAQAKIAAAQIGQADAELALVEDQLARTRVRAQAAGIITKGDLSQSIGAPAERGQVLFEAAPLDNYRIILQLDERDVAEVAPGQSGRLLLAALPSDPLPFVVEKITPVSEAREGRNYFRVEARLRQTPGNLRPGMEGVAKIDLGQRHLLWNWTHRLTDWLRLLVWSWLP